MMKTIHVTWRNVSSCRTTDISEMLMLRKMMTRPKNLAEGTKFANKNLYVVKNIGSLAIGVL